MIPLAAALALASRQALLPPVGMTASVTPKMRLKSTEVKFAPRLLVQATAEPLAYDAFFTHVLFKPLQDTSVTAVA